MGCGWIQAKLYDVMTSSETHAPLSTMGKPESPWMVDGGGMPPNSLALMKRLVWLSFFSFMYQEFVLDPFVLYLVDVWSGPLLLAFQCMNCNMNSTAVWYTSL